MKLSASGSPSVTLDEALKRLTEFRATEPFGRLYAPNCLAGIIWPGHRMQSQGAGAAATRVLKKLGARWHSEKWGRDWHCGWRLDGIGLQGGTR